LGRPGRALGGDRHRRGRALRPRPSAVPVAPLRARGLTDPELADLLCAAAFFAWANRLMLSLGEPSQPDAACTRAPSPRPTPQDPEVLLPVPAGTAVVLNSYTNEFLRAIGAGDRVAGVDRASLDRLPYLDLAEDRIIAEGLDQLNYEAIAGLEPDVVILPRNA